MNENTPKIAVSDAEIKQCFDVMAELRTQLQRDGFLETIRHMELDGFRLAYIEVDDEIVAVAGYRIYSNLFFGKNLYVDDLVTSKKVRSRGHGESLIRWLREKADTENCDHFRLDSGVQRGRAHKFYYNQGFTIAAFHFAVYLKDQSDEQ